MTRDTLRLLIVTTSAFVVGCGIGAAEDAEREWQSARLLDYIERRAG